ncbi:hypothetical protein [Acholeplasma palmae]|uniref:hypothetical protein n=1 Tax=Acholeplasma palmae TaxID=38986 RepID=UPI000B333D3F|nr:hypothetical protein [Alteracholeplasma palmae]
MSNKDITKEEMLELVKDLGPSGTSSECFFIFNENRKTVYNPNVEGNGKIVYSNKL